MADTDDTATLRYPGGEIDLQIVHATEGADGIALGPLLAKTGHTTFDVGPPPAATPARRRAAAARECP